MIYRYDEDLAPTRQDTDTTRLWVSDQQWLAILERVQRGQPVLDEAAQQEDCRRLHPRQTYECRCLLRLSDAAGTFIVRSQDISSGGLRFVHGHPLRASTRCTIALQAENGPGRILSAVVAWCKEIEFYDPDVEAYEVGVKFDSAIDVPSFTGGGAA
ncbi:MAG: PilZ domain-containing protein [Phycisphaeraceae bacterium]|nr:PilZ domain-containing protein [Phycisphaeraceae bacterium]